MTWREGAQGKESPRCEPGKKKKPIFSEQTKSNGKVPLRGKRERRENKTTKKLFEKKTGATAHKGEGTECVTSASSPRRDRRRGRNKKKTN